MRSPARSEGRTESTRSSDRSGEGSLSWPQYRRSPWMRSLSASSCRQPPWTQSLSSPSWRRSRPKRSRLPLSPWLFVAFVIAASAPAAHAGSELTAEESLASRARARLDRHVDARPLAAWRDTCTTAAAEAFDFLFAWLPTSDLAAWRADQVIADIRLALDTRAAVPWGSRIDDETFLRFVLPHRVAQEPVEPWRARLHDLLWPRVQDLSLPAAILETNRFCREWATFQPSSARDQAPSATMARGLGRCEEEMIFFVCAARSVGIPARPCYTPWWTASDDNHAWVEAWAGDRWHYLGACEPEEELDRAWFSGPARRAGLVLSVAYGEEIPGLRESAVEVYARGRGVTLVNSTGVYTTAGRAAVRWADLAPAAALAHPAADRGAPPAEGAGSLNTAPPDTTVLHRAKIPVAIHVFNSGSLVPLGIFPAGDTISLGPQDYFVSAAVDGRPAGAFLTVGPGEVTTISLDPRAGVESLQSLFAQPFSLRIPEPPAAPARAVEEPVEPEAASGAGEAKPDDGAPGEARSAAQPQAGRIQADPREAERREAEQRRAADERAASMRADSLRRVALASAWRARDQRGADAVLEHVNQVPPRAATWLSFLLSTSPREAAEARALVLEMDDKDFLEAEPAAVAEIVRESRRLRSLRATADARFGRGRTALRVARPRSEWGPRGAALADSIWNPFVLSPRIDNQPFDPGLWTTLPSLRDRGGRLREPSDILAAFAARVRREEPGRLGHVARPSESWSSGWATPTAARVALVGLFRRNGIPARVEAESRWVEAWWDDRWVPCDPFDPASWDRREGDVAAATGTPGHLRAVIRDGARVMTEAEPWRHFRLARFTEGRFAPLSVDYPIEAGTLEMDLEPGPWWLIGGLRQSDGSPRIRAVPFALSAGESIAVELDLGRSAGSAGWTELPVALRETSGGQPTLVFAFKPEAEPSIRTASALLGALPALRARGIRIVVLPLRSEGMNAAPSPDLPIPEFPQSAAVRPITPNELDPLFGIAADTELPVLLLADREGIVVLRLTGFRSDAADQLRQALERLDDSGRARPE